MISFFGSMISFDFVTDSPSDQILLGSLLFSSVMTMFSLGYELRRYVESI